MRRNENIFFSWEWFRPHTIEKTCHMGELLGFSDMELLHACPCDDLTEGILDILAVDKY
jgi:hypothetical protein